MAHQVSPTSAMASAIASVEIEGFTVSLEARELLGRVVAGEMTAREAMDEVLQNAREASANSSASNGSHSR